MRTAPVRPPERGPTFLAIRWQQTEEEGGVVVEASLCRKHRNEIALRYPSAHGCGRLGDSCDICEGRQPKRLSELEPLKPLGDSLT